MDTNPFGHDLGDGWSLTLRDLGTVESVHALIERNLDRLQAAEPWAWETQRIEHTVWQTERLLARYAMDQCVPCVLRDEGRIVGVVTLSLDPSLGTASLGYWIDADREGRGGVRRACSALLDVASDREMRRVEIRTAADNLRSRGLAERLGFVLEGVLRSAFPLGPRRVDAAVYGMLLPRSTRTDILGAWPGSDDAETTRRRSPSMPTNSAGPSTRASSSPGRH